LKHPIVYLGDDRRCPDLTDVFGLVKCRVLAPQKLFSPVLPFHLDGKNMFFLCIECAHAQNQDTCRHLDADRSFVGTWVSTELNLAIVKGYRVLKVIEVCLFITKFS
jgi:hypothetical protein